MTNMICDLCQAIYSSSMSLFCTRESIAEVSAILLTEEKRVDQELLTPNILEGFYRHCLASVDEYKVNNGEFSIHVAFRRKKFSGLSPEGEIIANLARSIIGADSPSMHHYELVSWFLDRDHFVYGCLLLSFDWAFPDDNDVKSDCKKSLFHYRQPRMFQINWFPNKDPQKSYFDTVSDDDKYEYLFIGSRAKVSNHDIFIPSTHGLDAQCGT